MPKSPRNPKREKKKTKRPAMESLFPGWEIRQHFKYVSKTLQSNKPPKEKARAIALQIIGMRREILALLQEKGMERNKVNILLKETWRVYRVRESKSFTKAQANAFLNIVKDFIDSLPQ